MPCTPASSFKSIPLDMEFVPEIATHVAWLDMFAGAQKSIDIAAYYFALTDGERACTRRPLPAVAVDPNNSRCVPFCSRAGAGLPGGSFGTAVYNGIVSAAKRGVSIRIVVVRLSFMRCC